MQSCLGQLVEVLALENDVQVDGETGITARNPCLC